MVGIATLISVPIGILAAVYLAILIPMADWRTPCAFWPKVLTGFPSILAGVFVYAVMVVTMKTYSALAGGVALARTDDTDRGAGGRASHGDGAEENEKDAAYGMGLHPHAGHLEGGLPAGASGILTGVMLAIAGAAGNSAPLLFTALFSNYYLTSLTRPTASLAILIFNFSGMPYDNQIELAWAASLVLVLIVLVFNILARIIGRQKY